MLQSESRGRLISRGDGPAAAAERGAEAAAGCAPRADAQLASEEGREASGARPAATAAVDAAAPPTSCVLLWLRSCRGGGSRPALQLLPPPMWGGASAERQPARSAQAGGWAVPLAACTQSCRDICPCALLLLAAP